MNAAAANFFREQEDLNVMELNKLGTNLKRASLNVRRDFWDWNEFTAREEPGGADVTRNINFRDFVLAPADQSFWQRGIVDQMIHVLRLETLHLEGPQLMARLNTRGGAHNRVVTQPTMSAFVERRVWRLIVDLEDRYRREPPFDNITRTELHTADVECFVWTVGRLACIYAAMDLHFHPNSGQTFAQIWRSVMSGRRFLGLGNLNLFRPKVAAVTFRQAGWARYVDAALRCF